MIKIKPIAVVRNSRQELADDDWGETLSEIVIDDSLGQDSLDGIDGFSHVEIIFYFHQVDENKVETGARHPRNNRAWPKVGILAQRGKNRPNRLGLTMARIVKRDGRSLFVEGLDAVDGTPVIDIKPVMREFLPREEIKQPAWSTELMVNYWTVNAAKSPAPLTVPDGR